MSDREFELKLNGEEILVPATLPLLPLRDVVVFPFMVTPLLVGREQSIEALEIAMERDKLICVSTQYSPETNAPGITDIYPVGTVLKILQVIRTPDQTVKILVEGIARVSIEDMTNNGDFSEVRIFPIVEIDTVNVETEALTRSIKDRFKEYVRLNKRLPDEILMSVLNMDGIDRMTDSISASIVGKVQLKQQLLAEPSLVERMRKVNKILADELEILQVELKIEDEVQSQVHKNQKEFYLNEQMRAIRKELGYGADDDSEIDEYHEKIEEAKLPEDAADSADRELNRLAKMPAMSPEAAVVRNYLDTLIALPWHERTHDRLDTKKVRSALDEDHYGLEKVKERILEFLAVLKMTKKIQGSILCLVGPPGVGKTSLGRSIADSMNRKFVRIALGGVRDEAEIRGHRRTYIGSKPGRIIESLRRAGTRNPVFLLDEIDKMGNDFRGDPSSALLEVLDPEQNTTFSDHFLEVDFDLSEVMFITTANSLHTIPAALQDRMEVIRLPGYLDHEKLAIAENFLIPRQLERNGVTKWKAGFKPQALEMIIEGYTRESGVRQLEREIASICRKVAKHRSEKGRYPGSVSARNLEKYLGITKYRRRVVEREPEVGVVTGLAWTIVGGEILQIESTSMPGGGQLKLTGNLKDVMKESAETALSFARTRCLDLPDDFIKKTDLHIHVPEGAVPKDGPSAGIAMATSIVSLLLNEPVRADVAMTGEVTLRGKVLPIGGLPEKAVAAVRAGAKVVIIPKENEKDFLELPDLVKDNLEVHMVETMDEVLKIALVNPGKVNSVNKTHFSPTLNRGNPADGVSPTAS
jgi:ATP-dependent Lon protease